eukprot:4652259-Pleurochrysis_carterae.AAC.1
MVVSVDWTHVRSVRDACTSTETKKEIQLPSGWSASFMRVTHGSSAANARESSSKLSISVRATQMRRRPLR